MPEKTRYIDAEKFKEVLNGINIGRISQYNSDPVVQAIDDRIANSVEFAIRDVISQMTVMIDQASEPYDKCLLCKQRDEKLPDHPLGDSR